MNYLKTGIHKRIIRNIALNIEILVNDNDFEISEYDVQAFMSLFLRRNLLNTEYKINRESFGKFDCAISKRNSNDPSILFELKTFVKKKEKLHRRTSYNAIIKDFEKLAKGLKKYPNARGFFILVCKYTDVKNGSEFEFLSEHLKGRGEWREIEEHKGKYRIRPSSKVGIGRTYVITWEIKKAKSTT